MAGIKHNNSPFSCLAQFQLSTFFSSLPPFSFLQDLQFAEIFFKSFICSCFARFPLCRDLPAVSDSPLDIHLSKQILLKHWNMPSANCQENHKKL